MRPKTNITWFEHHDFIGSEVSFPEPNRSTWRLQVKLKETECLFTEEDATTMDGLASEARAVFVASKLSGNGPEEAIIKIRMQIPWIDTAHKSASLRAQQATTNLLAQSEMEPEALSILTKAGCSSSPALLNWMQGQQDSNQWVPGGYIIHILMEKLPGINPTYEFDKMDRAERDALRAAFKKAWQECLDCGVSHGDHSLSNLLWDRGTQKCYLVDFEVYHKPGKREKWQDFEYILWNLAQQTGRDYYDMSTWEL